MLDDVGSRESVPKFRRLYMKTAAWTNPNGCFKIPAIENSGG